MHSKPWIENVSMEKIISGEHRLDKGNTILIQIQDVHTEFVTPKFKDKFKAIHQFQFNDNEYFFDKKNFNTHEADRMANILIGALDNNDNIVVHCKAGIYRSGAVAAVGSVIGFDAIGDIETPNKVVFNRLLDSIYDINPDLI